MKNFCEINRALAAKKKSLLLIPLFLFSLVATTAAITIDNSTANALQTALNNAASVDEIVMDAGIYEESGNYLAFTGKDITVRAAEGAEVIIKTVCPVRLKEGAKAEFINVKFDCSTIGSYDYVIVAADDTDNKRVVLTGCEFYGWEKNKAMIEATSERRLASVTIDKCYFHDCMKSVVFIENTGSINLSITNSTFANIATNTESFSAGVIDSRATTGSVLIDHCTFYNVLARNTDYAAIGKIATPGAVVSNCIFALPTSTADQRAIRDVATANNCLTFNYTKDSNWGIHGDVTKNNCIKEQDPLFTDAANGDFSFAGNWVTMELSPARGAATDGSDLGDPRWYSAEVLPEVDFASPYQFIGTKALLAGQIGLNANDHIEYYDTNDKGTATWKIHATRACILNAPLNMETGSSSGHIFKVEVLDADGNSIGELAEPSQSSHDGNIDLPGTLSIPAVGDYSVILYNLQSWSSAKLEGVTFTYVGGDVQDISSSSNTTLNVADAWFSSGGTREDGKIDFPDGSIQDGWVKWNISVAESKYYDITVNIESSNGHNYGVRIYNADRTIPLSEGGQTSAASPRELGRVSIPAGDYIVEVTNSIQYSDAKLVSVIFAPVGASATELPNTLEFGDAVLSDRAHITDGNLYFAPIGDTNPAGEWASWAVTTDHDGTFLFSMDVNSTNGQSYRISIYDDTDNLIDSFEKKASSGAAATIKHYFNLAAGNYSVKVENTTAWSRGYLTSLVVTEPSLLTLSDTDESNSTIAANYRNGTHDIQTIRTIAAGMYNTICLPFDVNADQMKEVFGNDVDLRAMSAATIEGEVISLDFDAATSIYRGTPYLIKTASDIVNPIFVDVEIKAEAGDGTGGEGFAADFIGTFIKQSITASESNLFLGANDKLYFSSEDVTIKGFRAYFAVNPAAGAPTRARIVMQEDVVTELELVEGALPEVFGNVHKLIENGQLIIVKDGAHYNAFGVRVK